MGDTSNPKLVILFSGKRKSGKDFVTDNLKVNRTLLNTTNHLVCSGAAWREGGDH